MGRFFSGLAQSGAWCCFDEFNRIDIEVLSVIAQQLLTSETLKHLVFMFEGREIQTHSELCGIHHYEPWKVLNPLRTSPVRWYRCTRLCSEQLSQQDHYDFGMRAVKSVLVMAGALKRGNPNLNEILC
ncbi:Dynein heavy chain 6, axonemal [Desmophyllum pertusum]|uniref:Dynein heavy chain 6, axonemal n=1 Tax=Desmophyllum pertusum TaxID=174260 RepID=A0A9W9ZAV4_9CNID|nr:Dynein heavy chain 6, axonemal [Desmophyllum pertusum]